LLELNLSSEARDKRKEEFDTQKAELYEELSHPTRILILQSLSEESMSFSELKRRTGIDSSGNLSFHLNKLDNLIRTTSEGNYALSDEGKEAIRVIEATERVTSSDIFSSSPTILRAGRRRWLRARTIVVALFVVVLILSASLVVTGTVLAPQTQSIPSGTARSPLNFSMSPGAKLFWFGMSDISGTFHIVYYLDSSYSTGGTGEIELQINGYSRNNGTYVLTTQYNLLDYYVDEFIHFPSDELVNFTFVNLFSGNATVNVAILHFDYVTYPYQSIGTTLLYVGSALLAIDTGLALWWLLASYGRRKMLVSNAHDLRSKVGDDPHYKSLSNGVARI
jgi:DNA-binding HxlR family transcriptional regulator